MSQLINRATDQTLNQSSTDEAVNHLIIIMMINRTKLFSLLMLPVVVPQFNNFVPHYRPPIAFLPTRATPRGESARSRLPPARYRRGDAHVCLTVVPHSVHRQIPAVLRLSHNRSLSL